MDKLQGLNSNFIAGGRHDNFFKEKITNLLNESHLFVMDKKVWIQEKYTFNSEWKDFIENDCLGVIAEYYSYERVLFTIRR